MSDHPTEYPPPPPEAGFPPPPPGFYMDPHSGMVLPNGTALAGVGRRVGAFFLAIPLAIVTLGIGYVIWGAIVWSRGQTPALQVLGMRCWIPASGRVPGWGVMALREVVGRWIVESWVALIGLVSFVLFLATNPHRSLHDIIGGTVVLRDPDKVLA